MYTNLPHQPNNALGFNNDTITKYKNRSLKRKLCNAKALLKNNIKVNRQLRTSISTVKNDRGWGISNNHPIPLSANRTGGSGKHQ